MQIPIQQIIASVKKNSITQLAEDLNELSYSSTPVADGCGDKESANYQLEILSDSFRNPQDEEVRIDMVVGKLPGRRSWGTGTWDSYVGKLWSPCWKLWSPCLFAVLTKGLYYKCMKGLILGCLGGGSCWLCR